MTQRVCELHICRDGTWMIFALKLMDQDVVIPPINILSRGSRTRMPAIAGSMRGLREKRLESTKKCRMCRLASSQAAREVQESNGRQDTIQYPLNALQRCTYLQKLPVVWHVCKTLLPPNLNTDVRQVACPTQGEHLCLRQTSYEANPRSVTKALFLLHASPCLPHTTMILPLNQTGQPAEKKQLHQVESYMLSLKPRSTWASPFDK